MLRFSHYDIVFQEIPDEVTLAINISNCPNRCRGCHSPYLMENKGRILSEGTIAKLLDHYQEAITCICFMGGDADPKEVERLAGFVKRKARNSVKTGWYSGRSTLPEKFMLDHFNYIKLGPYRENLGGLDNPGTNQRFYRIKDHSMIDMTFRFQAKTSSVQIYR